MNPDIEKAIAQAWAKVEPILRTNPDELAARRARRRTRLLQTPPRAWCLAVRANDTRLTPWRIPMVPDHPVWWDAENHLYRRQEHQVILEARDLAWLCRPVSVAWPGQTPQEIARNLGAPVDMVHRAMKHGQFSIRTSQGIRGRKITILYTKSMLDPAGILMDRIDDPAWCTMFRHVSDHIPDDFSQSILRRPIYRKTGTGYHFVGWFWICPACGRLAHRIYCPIPGPVAPFVKVNPPGTPDAWIPLPVSFACKNCHRVHDYGRLDCNGWNELIAHLTGGLLYGHEVPRPAWYPTRRKHNKFLHRTRSPRHAQITRFLLDTDLTHLQIARRLGMSHSHVRTWASNIYRRHGVHTRQALRNVLAPQPQLHQSKAAG